MLSSWERVEPRERPSRQVNVNFVRSFEDHPNVSALGDNTLRLCYHFVQIFFADGKSIRAENLSMEVENECSFLKYLKKTVSFSFEPNIFQTMVLLIDFFLNIFRNF